MVLPPNEQTKTVIRGAALNNALYRIGLQAESKCRGKIKLLTTPIHSSTFHGDHIYFVFYERRYRFFFFGYDIRQKAVDFFCEPDGRVTCMVYDRRLRDIVLSELADYAEAFDSRVTVRCRDQSVIGRDGPAGPTF